MNHDHLAQDFRKAFRMTIFIFSSVIANLFILAIVAEIIRARFKPFAGFVPTRNPAVLRYVFYAAGVIIIIVLRILQKPLIGKIAGKPAQDVLRRLSRASITTAAFCEGPGLLGFVLFLLTGLHRDLIVLLIVSLFLSFMYFPRKRAWEERFRESLPAGMEF